MVGCSLFFTRDTKHGRVRQHCSSINTCQNNHIGTNLDNPLVCDSVGDSTSVRENVLNVRITHPPYTSAPCSFPNRSRVVRYVPSLPTVFDIGPRVFVGALGPPSQSMTIATTFPIDEPFHCIVSPIRRDWAVGRLMCFGLRQGCLTRPSTVDGVGWRVVPSLGRLWTGPNRSEGCQQCLWLRRGSERIVRRIASGVGGRLGLGWVG